MRYNFHRPSVILEMEQVHHHNAMAMTGSHFRCKHLLSEVWRGAEMRQSSLKVHAMFGNVVWTRTASTGSRRPPTYTFILNIIALSNLHIYIRLVELDRRAGPSLSFREPVKKKLDSFSFHNDRIALSLCILLLTVLVCQKQWLRNWHNDSSVVLCGYVVQNLKHRYRMNENIKDRRTCLQVF